MARTAPVVMIFAGTDPSSGAGLQADVLTVAGLGCYPVSVVTCITMQDTCGVEKITAVDERNVELQARLLLKDISVDAFKLGILGSLANVRMVASIVADYPHIPLVIDPISNSGGGYPFVTRAMVEAMRELLFPKATILTPNSLEVAYFSHLFKSSTTKLDKTASAESLLQLGCKNVLVTGTHDKTESVTNTWYRPHSPPLDFTYHRLPSNYHGSGCTLASAIATCLATGSSMEDALVGAQKYTWESLAHALDLGKGQLLPDRMCLLRSLLNDVDMDEYDSGSHHIH